MFVSLRHQSPDLAVQIDKTYTVKAFYFVGQKFRRLKTTDIFVGT